MSKSTKLRQPYVSRRASYVCVWVSDKAIEKKIKDLERARQAQQEGMARRKQTDAKVVKYASAADMTQEQLYQMVSFVHLLRITCIAFRYSFHQITYPMLCSSEMIKRSETGKVGHAKLFEMQLKDTSAT